MNLFVWDPNRHIGPFYLGSELTAIKTILNGKGANWFFTDTSSSTWPFYQKYTPSGYALATQVPGTLHQPGRYPSSTTAGFNNTPLSLVRVSYSSRYGGSIEMIFTADGDFEYELRGGTTLWDLKGLEMDVFFVPDPLAFDRAVNLPQLMSQTLFIEFRYLTASAYQVAGSAITSLSDPQEAVLGQTLAGIADAIRNAHDTFTTSCSVFVYGYLHEKFQDLLTNGAVVNGIDLSDDFFDPHTTAGEATVFVFYRVNKLSVGRGGGDSFTVDLSSGPSWGMSFGWSDRSWTVVNKQGSVFQVLHVMPLASCDQFSQLAMLVFVRDASVWYAAQPQQWSIDCEALRADAQAGVWGPKPPVIMFQDLALTNETSGGQEGTISIEASVTLDNR